MDLLNELLSWAGDAIAQRAQHMSGMMLPPEQRSIMPGVNEANTLQRALAGHTPYVDPELLNSLAFAGTFAPGGKFYHGTPYVFQQEAKSAGGLAGPGFYVTDSPAVADTYAAGSTFKGGEQGLKDAMQTQQQAAESLKRVPKDMQFEWEKALAQQPQLGPNVRPYQVAPHETFNMDQFLNRSDLDLLRNAVLDPKKTPALDADTRSMLVNILTHPATTQQTGADLMYGMQTALAPGLDKLGVSQSTYDASANAINKLMQQAGFGSITYSGGQRMGTASGGPLHRALNILDLKLLQPYLDYASGIAK